MAACLFLRQWNGNWQRGHLRNATEMPEPEIFTLRPATVNGYVRDGHPDPKKMPRVIDKNHGRPAIYAKGCWCDHVVVADVENNPIGLRRSQLSQPDRA